MKNCECPACLSMQNEIISRFNECDHLQPDEDVYVLRVDISNNGTVEFWGCKCGWIPFRKAPLLCEHDWTFYNEEFQLDTGIFAPKNTAICTKCSSLLIDPKEYTGIISKNEL